MRRVSSNHTPQLITPTPMAPPPHHFLMEPRELLNAPRELLDAHAEPAHHLLLFLVGELQEALDQISIDEAASVHLLALVGERSPLGVAQAAHPLDDARERGAHAREEGKLRLRQRGDHADDAVDRAVQERRRRRSATLVGNLPVHTRGVGDVWGSMGSFLGDIWGEMSQKWVKTWVS